MLPRLISSWFSRSLSNRWTPPHLVDTATILFRKYGSCWRCSSNGKSLCSSWKLVVVATGDWGRESSNRSWFWVSTGTRWSPQVSAPSDCSWSNSLFLVATSFWNSCVRRSEVVHQNEETFTAFVEFVIYSHTLSPTKYYLNNFFYISLPLWLENLIITKPSLRIVHVRSSLKTHLFNKFFPHLHFGLVGSDGLLTGLVRNRLTQLHHLVVHLPQPVTETGKTGQERVEPRRGVLVATRL